MLGFVDRAWKRHNHERLNTDNCLSCSPRPGHRPGATAERPATAALQTPVTTAGALGVHYPGKAGSLRPSRHSTGSSRPRDRRGQLTARLNPRRWPPHAPGLQPRSATRSPDDGPGRQQSESGPESASGPRAGPATHPPHARRREAGRYWGKPEAPLSQTLVCMSES